MICECTQEEEPQGLRINSLGLNSKGVEIVALNYRDNLLHLESDLVNQKSRDVEVNNDKNSNQRLLSSLLELDCDVIQNRVSSCLATLLKTAAEQLVASASTNLVHVGPFRATPSRFYDQNSHDNAVERVVTLIHTLMQDEKTHSELSSWWSDKSKVKFSGREIEGTLQSILVSPKWLENDNEESDLTILDTGHGYSQVLPIMGEAMSAAPGSVVILEQPEAHLHPNLHPDIADWIIEKSLDPEKNLSFVVETHSEYFLRRVYRRLVEKTIKPEALSIIYVEECEQEGTPKLRPVDVSETEGFTWPKGFYEKTLEDNLAIGKALD